MSKPLKDLTDQELSDNMLNLKRRIEDNCEYVHKNRRYIAYLNELERRVLKLDKDYPNE